MLESKLCKCSMWQRGKGFSCS